MDFQALLDGIDRDLRPELGREGRVASYIPALARVPAAQFGIALRTCAGEEAAAGDSAVPFSIQSVSKLFALTLAMRLLGDALWERIHREPSGNPFNSLLQLESEQGIPRNPFINAGAIAVSDRLLSVLGGGAKASLLEMLSGLAGEADRLRRRGRGVGGGQRLSQRRPRQLHEELRQDRQRRRRRARLLLPSMRAAR